jgi:predicted nucleic acid-binding protein
LQKGVSKLPEGARRDELQAWIEHDMTLRFTGRIIDIDMDAALIWGRLHGESQQSLPVMDSLIAATAKAHGLVVVTRNVKDIERCQVRVCNPWL